MTAIYRFISFGVASMLSVGVGFAETKLSVVEILGQQYYVYETKKDDTLFGISRRYGWDDVELRRMNPKAISPLEKGMKLYYPCETAPAPAIVVNPATVPVEPVTHVVKKGETIYSVSVLYGIPVETIYALNPSSKSGVNEGEVLNLKISTARKKSENPRFYTVKTGDTLYKVAKEFNTTIASIMDLNPGVSERNFTAGSTIKLPANGSGVKTVDKKVERKSVASFTPYTVKKEDTWESISRKTGVDKEMLVNANRGTTKLKNKAIIGIPEISTDSVSESEVFEDPREQTVGGVAEIYDDLHGTMTASENPGISIALLLSEPTERKDLDFTRGFLTAVDRLKHKDYNISLKVINVTSNSDSVVTVLKDYSPDLVFITTDKSVPAYLTEYSRNSKTPVVNTFDIKDETYTNNPYFIQLLTPSNYFNEEIADKIANDYRNSTVLFVGESDASDQLATSLQSKLDCSQVMSLTLDELKAFVPDASKNYLIYAHATKKNDISALLGVVRGIREENPISEINVLGRPNWIVYDETLSQELHDANAMFPSRFFYDKDTHEARQFLTEYKSLFNMTPVKSYPMYAAVGYDSALYFIPGMISADGDMNLISESRNAVQSNFALKRPANWSGFVNPIVYLVHFTPYGTIEKIEVK